MSVANPLALARGMFVASALLALGVGSALAQAESQIQYVIEQLVVSVNAQADGSGDRVDQIKSGDRVEVLEHQGDQARVRLSSGQEGWLRSSYLSNTPPMRDQLKARTDELEKLRAEKTKLETELTNARKAVSAAAQAAGAAAAPAPTAAVASDPAPRESESEPASVESPAPDTARSNPPMFANEGVMPSRPSWVVAVAGSLLTLIAGFALGWRVLDKRIRAKYGGLRIY